MLRSFSCFFLFLLLSSACSSLPDYASPYVGIEAGEGNWNEGISYRQLELSDFRAQVLSKEFRAYADKLNAHTRVIIRPKKTSTSTVTATQTLDRIVYHGSMESLAFEALMIPEFSWCNPKIAPEKMDYVLQHEQIHFALMEIKAREMTREVERDSSFFSVFGSSSQEVQKLLGNKVTEYINRNIDSVVAEHTVFDEETSLYHDPEVQQQWYAEVTEKLLLPVSTP